VHRYRAPIADGTDPDAGRTEMNDSRVVELLHEAAETHHRVYRLTDGDDPDWATWYADWLVRLSELPDLLGRSPGRSELTWLLVTLDRESGDVQERWEERYARRIVEHFAG
jgi:hypothetical protein